MPQPTNARDAGGRTGASIAWSSCRQLQRESSADERATALLDQSWRLEEWLPKQHSQQQPESSARNHTLYQESAWARHRPDWYVENGFMTFSLGGFNHSLIDSFIGGIGRGTKLETCSNVEISSLVGHHGCQ
jgi:hypothetical protein